MNEGAPTRENNLDKQVEALIDSFESATAKLKTIDPTTLTPEQSETAKRKIDFISPGLIALLGFEVARHGWEGVKHTGPEAFLGAVGVSGGVTIMAAAYHSFVDELKRWAKS